MSIIHYQEEAIALLEVHKLWQTRIVSYVTLVSSVQFAWIPHQATSSVWAACLPCSCLA